MVAELFRAPRVALSSMRAHRSWMNAISNNLANIHTLDTGKVDRGGNFVPYARQVPVFAKVLSEQFRENKINEDVLNGVEVKQVAELQGKYKKVYDPTHPASRKGGEDAGYVYYPDINLAQEMADMKIASSSYEANLSVISVSREMSNQALGIIK